MNEFALIQQFFSQGFVQHPCTSLAIGDDCSIVHPPAHMDLVQSLDTQIADVHFPANAPANLIAERALRCAASDLAAMGAQPHGFHLALTLPEANISWLEAFSSGLKSAAAELDLQLLGGDTTKGPNLVISVAVQGWVPQGQALKRSGAQVGDDIWVSDVLGRAALALPLVLHDPADTSDLARSYYFPQVHFSLGQTLLGKSTACMDVSDGLLQDAGHIARASKVNLVLDAERIPTLADLRSQEWWLSLTGGDDYQLLFTAPTAYRSELMNLRQQYTGLCCIGRVQPMTEQAVILQLQGQELSTAEPYGFQHF